MTFRQEVEALITTFFYNYYKSYVEPLEMEVDELRAKNLQLNNKATRWKNKYNELKSCVSDESPVHRELAIKYKKERDQYKKMYLDEKKKNRI